jgi:hypothetical protein
VAADTAAFFGPTFDYEDFNTKARAIDVGVLEYAGCYLPCIRGAVLYLCDLANTEGAAEGYSVKLLLCRTEDSARGYLRACPGDPTTGNALFGDHVTFQTTPTHCFFWAYAKPYAQLLTEVASSVPNWREYVARVVTASQQRAAARDDARAREAAARDAYVAKEAAQKAEKAAAVQRERDRQRQEKQHLRALRAKHRADRETLRKHASVCSRCKGPIRPGEPRFETPLGFQCKQCGRSGLWATDSVEGRDTKGRNKYRFGYRRADGIWVCPLSYAAGVLNLQQLYTAAPINERNASSPDRYRPDGCYQTPVRQCSDTLARAWLQQDAVVGRRETGKRLPLTV